MSQQVAQNAYRTKGAALKKNERDEMTKLFADTDNKLKSLRGKYGKAPTPEAKKVIDEQENALRMNTLKKFYQATGVVPAN